MSKDIEYLCETIGLQPLTFYFSESEGELVLCSEIHTTRLVGANTEHSEKATLWEAQCFYEELIASLFQEYELIQRFYEEFYDDENPKCIPVVRD